jgi:hypothetical protein
LSVTGRNRRDHDLPHQTQRIDPQMSVASFDVLAPVKPKC